MSLAYYVPASVDISTFFEGKNNEFSNHDIIYRPVLPAEAVLQQDHGEHSAFALYLYFGFSRSYRHKIIKITAAFFYT